jgi:hypothetical protein
MIKVPDAGGLAIFNAYFKGTPIPTGFTLQLFTAAAPPTLADTDAFNTFTVATTNGAAAVPLSVAGATVSAVGNIPQVAWAEQTFTLTGVQPNPIQGYQVISNTNVVVFEELLAAPVTAANGVILKITPTFQGGNGTPT